MLFVEWILPEKPIIEANINFVVNTERGTNLG